VRDVTPQFVLRRRDCDNLKGSAPSLLQIPKHPHSSELASTMVTYPEKTNHLEYMNNQPHYMDPADAFVPYDTQQPHGTYDQGGYNYPVGYTDEPVRGSHSPTAVDSHELDESPAPIPRTKGPR
jgi:hypothetical protein